MALDNFLPINRELQKHWIYKDSCYLHCWLEILLNARFAEEPKKDIYKGVLYTINRGEFIYSRPTYADRLKISEGKLKTLMKLLISDKMIEPVFSLGNNKPTVYRILNYETYNARPSERVEPEPIKPNPVQVETKSEPSGDQVRTKSRPLKNIVNTGKIEKPKELKTFLSDSYEYRLSKLLLDKIVFNNPEYKQPNLQSWSSHIDLMIRIDKRDPQTIARVIDFCQKDLFWRSNILSTKKLREKFDQLALKMQTGTPNGKIVKGSTEDLQATYNSDVVQNFLRKDDI